MANVCLLIAGWFFVFSVIGVVVILRLVNPIVESKDEL